MSNSVPFTGGEERRTVAAIVASATATRPFPESHADYAEYRVLCAYPCCPVRLGAFLIERGYPMVYLAIMDRLRLSGFTFYLAPHHRSILEDAYFVYAQAESSSTFASDLARREAPDDPRARLHQITAFFPVTRATTAQVRETPRCAVCQGDLVRRQQVRALHNNCVFHTKCIDRWLSGSRVCPVCRISCVV
jgi:hypothetical protein